MTNTKPYRNTWFGTIEEYADLMWGFGKVLEAKGTAYLIKSSIQGLAIVQTVGTQYYRITGNTDAETMEKWNDIK